MTIAEMIKAAFRDGWEYGQVSNFPENTLEEDWLNSESYLSLAAFKGLGSADGGEGA